MRTTSRARYGRPLLATDDRFLLPKTLRPLLAIAILLAAAFYLARLLDDIATALACR